MQGRAGRVILDLQRTTPTVDVLSTLSWVPIEERWNYQRQVFMCKINLSVAPEYLVNRFVLVSSRPSNTACTRGAKSNKFCPPHSNTNWGRRRLICHGVHQWNMLPPSLRTCNNPNSFKLNLKRAMKNDLVFWKLWLLPLTLPYLYICIYIYIFISTSI